MLLGFCSDAVGGVRRTWRGGEKVALVQTTQARCLSSCRPTRVYGATVALLHALRLPILVVGALKTLHNMCQEFQHREHSGVSQLSQRSTVLPLLLR